MLRYSIVAAVAMNLVALNLGEVSFENGYFRIQASGFDSKEIGKMTHKKLFECLPGLDGVYQYEANALLFYPKSMHKGIKYECKAQNNILVLNSGDFEIDSVFSLTKSDILIKFNDSVDEKAFIENIEIYDEKNLAKHPKKFEIIDKTDDRFHIKIHDINKDTKIFIKDSLTSKFGARIKDGYEIAQENAFFDNPKAKTIQLSTPQAVSLDNAEFGVRVFFKEWVDDAKFKKFININGVNDFRVSEIRYSDDSEQNALGYYYFVDIISSEFKPQTSYKIDFLKGFGDNDLLLREDVSFDVKFQDYKPFLKFNDDGIYMSNIGDLGITSVNTGVVKVVVEKLQDQNFRYFLNYDSDDLAKFSKEIASKNYDIGGGLNDVVKSRLKLDFAGRTDGIYTVTAYYDDAKSVSKQVFLTDIGLSAKISSDEIFIYAGRLSNNSIVANADVKVYSSKNEVVASGITNDLGVFKFNQSKIGKDLASVVVSIGNEQSFIKLNDKNLLNPQDEINSQDMSEKQNAYVHFASNIIRPNENIMGQIIIKNQLLKPLSNMPTKLVIKDPQDKIIAQKTINTNDFGVINFNEEINSDLTGNFNIELIFANQIIANENFFVESFTPQRISNQITLQKSKFSIEEMVLAKFQSNYLFGGAAANLDGNAELNLYHKEYKSEKFSEYSFSAKSLEDGEIYSFSQSIKLDKNGKAEAIFNLQNNKTVASMLGGGLSLNINDDGKNVSSSQHFDIYAYDVMSGIKADKTQIDSGEQVKFSLVSLDPLKDEQVKDRKKAIIIKRKNWSYNVDENGVLRWDSEFDDVANFIQNTDNFTYNFTQGGSYEVSVVDTLSTHKASVNIEVNGWDDTTVMPTKELSKAVIKTDKKSYKKGDEMSVNVSSVLKNAIALITLENNGVKKFQLVKIDQNSATAKFKLDFDFDGLYVGVSVMRVADVGVLPFRAYEKIYVAADRNDKQMQVSIDAPKTIRSNSNLEVLVKAEPNADVSLFAVDLGILNITDYKIKNPIEFFSSFRTKSMLDYDFYSDISSFKKDGKILSFGGDMAAMARMRIDKFSSPVDKKNVKTFINMQTIKADQNGDAKFSVKIPQDFNSQINLATIALNSDKIGFNTQNIEVKDDIVIKPSASAYFIKDDEINYPVRLINTTNYDKNVSISVNSNIKTSLKTQNLILKPNENTKIELKLDANQTGKAFLNFSVDDGKQTFLNTQNFDIIPSYPLSTFTKSLLLDKEQKIKIDDDFNDIKIDASSSIRSLLSQNSNELINYPYGCVEQRSSKLLELNSLILNDDNKTKKEINQADIKRFIQSGIKDVLKMQKQDGSFGYWSELGFTNIFASLYTTFTLLELEKSGFEIPKNAKKNAINSLINFNSNEDTQALFAAYILSTQKKLDKARLNALFDKDRHEIIPLNAYLMAATLKNEGLLQESKVVMEQINHQGHALNENFGSLVRDKAFMLLLHARHFEKNSFSDDLADFLIKRIDTLASTQERAFASMALREYFKDLKDNVKFSITADGKKLDFNALAAVSITPKNKEITIKPEDKIYINITATGYKPLQINHKFADKTGLDIIRKFVDKNGKEIDLNALKLNDIIYSSVALQSSEDIAYGVVNETISSCFEVINENYMPNLRTQAVKTNLNLQHQNFQDDRVVSFYSLNANQAALLFTPLRVVRSGKCVLPAVNTENMYNEEQSDYDLSQKSFIIK